MAVTVLIRQGGDEELRLTLDAPRIVIGRGKSCDIQLPDVSVSPRHASIRLQGGRNLVIDEGSANGVVVMSPGQARSALVRLPPQTPRALSDGDLIRIGRVWLEVKFSVGVLTTAADAKAVAVEVLRQGLERDGEPVVARLLAPDGAVVLELGGGTKEYVLGRANDADLSVRDEQASRRHAAVARDGSSFRLRDLGSKRGTFVNDEPVVASGQKLADGDRVRIGDTTFVFRDPIAAAMATMQGRADVKLPESALPDAPPGVTWTTALVLDAPSDGLDGEDAHQQEASLDASFEEGDDEDEDPSALDQLTREPRGGGFAAVDAFVALVALGLLGVSALGLAYVLGG